MKHDISKLFCHILFVSFALLVIGNTALEAKPPSDSDISVAMKADEYGNSLSIDRTTSEQKVNIDLQGANIKSAIRLVGEISGKNIVVGEDIKGNITIKLKNSSWRSALDAIAKMSGLIVSEDGNVISVLSLEQWKKTVTEKRTVDTEISAEKDRVRDNEIKELANQGKLRQISIEAKIVEATDEFIRSLGVKWGATVYGSSGGYPSAIAMGTSASTSRTMAPSYPSGAGFLDPSGKAQYMSPVNFPSSVASPAVGFVIGGSNAVLEAQLSALESNSQGKIISSPKITTMDNVKATISQGSEIPYVTPASQNSPATVAFKNAVLKLDVKPTITIEGKILLEILATNDWPDYSKATERTNYIPPINTSRIESKVVVNDGDTIVIGGIHKSTDTKGVTGVPWLQNIPFLGWFFRSEDITKTQTQIMIFVTPRIVKNTDNTNSLMKK